MGEGNKHNWTAAELTKRVLCVTFFATMRGDSESSDESSDSEQ